MTQYEGEPLTVITVRTFPTNVPEKVQYQVSFHGDREVTAQEAIEVLTTAVELVKLQISLGADPTAHPSSVQ